MILINNLHGPYNAETSEGRGANAANNVINYFEEGKKIAEQKARQFMNGEIGLEEATKNQAVETLATAYIPYMPIDEETGVPDYKYGLAYSSVYISAFDSDQDGALAPQEAGPFGHVIDFVAPYGKITPGKFLTWLIFQDCTDVYNGVISPREAGASLMMAQKDPAYVKDQLKVLYFGHGIDNFEQEFITPQPAKRV
jgi:hypothetical protein